MTYSPFHISCGIEQLNIHHLLFYGKGEEQLLRTHTTKVTTSKDCGEFRLSWAFDSKRLRSKTHSTRTLLRSQCAGVRDLQSVCSDIVPYAFTLQLHTPLTLDSNATYLGFKHCTTVHWICRRPPLPFLPLALDFCSVRQRTFQHTTDQRRAENLEQIREHRLHYLPGDHV